MVADGRPPKHPEVLDTTPFDGGVRLRLAVPHALAWFAGHFPAEAVLPGYVQVGWAIAFARAQFGFGDDPCELHQVRFQRPVRPGARLELELLRDAGRPARVAWRLSEGGRPVGRGRMEFAAVP